jgi:hypothetical protein
MMRGAQLGLSGRDAALVEKVGVPLCLVGQGEMVRAGALVRDSLRTRKELFA